MLRSGARAAGRTAVAINQRRNSSLVAYATGFGSFTAGSLLASPIGSLLGTALAYNVCVVGHNHIHYTMDLFFKDYVQDYVVYNVLKYLTSLCLILLFGQVFVEQQ